ncbi:hypothetical protein CFP71_28145 [Amycolatopsis thailandensis]|uniref:DUF5753 domain-containing protein n=1 Tax=Amycolatopsis thailandensis TaxID=589330 RepID=A0A229RUV2_9PSEU|nr:Scr1 family TA system antitoxin-like transcriptional regulator [Amycolatopsis thailandensis]OXM50305.1 hypothetical protein CFP71_28145 [Amycolatopsis thailandensis]
MDILDEVRAGAVALCRAVETAVSIRCFGGMELPDLLLDGVYADQLWSMRRVVRPLHAIAGAMLQSRRVAMLRRDSPIEMSFVVNEHALTVLEHGRGDPATAAVQLQYLLDHTDERTRPLRVLPIDVGLVLPPDPEVTLEPGFVMVPDVTPGPAFTIVTGADGRVTVFADAPTPSGLRIVSDHLGDDRAVGFHTRRFSDLSDASLDHDSSRARIGDAIRRCEELAAVADGRSEP